MRDGIELKLNLPELPYKPYHHTYYSKNKNKTTQLLTNIKFIFISCVVIALCGIKTSVLIKIKLV